jgi:hypothetical protein
MKLLDIYLYLFIILFGNNLIQDSYLALTKPYWQIIITSYRLVLQVLYEVSGKFSVALKVTRTLFMAVFVQGRSCDSTSV